MPRHSYQLFSLYIFIILLATPTLTYAQRKHKKNDATMSYDVEPDRMIARAVQDQQRKKIESILIRQHSKLNTKYKEGIDVSRYQGLINWEQVATQEVSYAYMKATEGETLVDVTYAYNIKEARKHGLSVGSYHFYRPNISIDAQYNNMTRTIIKEDQDLVPIIDIEHRGNVSNEKFVADLKVFVERITQYYGKKPLLYTFHNFYNKYLVGLFPEHHWMIARYRSDAPTLNDGKEYIMWQYTSSGSILGIKGPVDRSRIMEGFHLQQVAF